MISKKGGKIAIPTKAPIVTLKVGRTCVKLGPFSQSFYSSSRFRLVLRYYINLRDARSRLKCVKSS